MGYDGWKARDVTDERAFVEVTGCHWCNGGGSEQDGPCAKAACESAAEDDYRLDRINAARRARTECVDAAVRVLLRAAQYIAEGETSDGARVAACVEEARAWRAQADGWQSKVDQLLGTEVRHAAE